MAMSDAGVDLEKLTVLNEMTHTIMKNATQLTCSDLGHCKISYEIKFVAICMGETMYDEANSPDVGFAYCISLTE